MNIFIEGNPCRLGYVQRKCLSSKDACPLPEYAGHGASQTSEESGEILPCQRGFYGILCGIYFLYGINNLKWASLTLARVISMSSTVAASSAAREGSAPSSIAMSLKERSYAFTTEEFRDPLRKFCRIPKFDRPVTCCRIQRRKIWFLEEEWRYEDHGNLAIEKLKRSSYNRERPDSTGDNMINK